MVRANYSMWEAKQEKATVGKEEENNNLDLCGETTKSVRLKNEKCF